jgi:hypothetical protein
VEECNKNALQDCSEQSGICLLPLQAASPAPLELSSPDDIQCIKFRAECFWGSVSCGHQWIISRQNSSNMGSFPVSRETSAMDSRLLLVWLFVPVLSYQSHILVTGFVQNLLPDLGIITEPCRCLGSSPRTASSSPRGWYLCVAFCFTHKSRYEYFHGDICHFYTTINKLSTENNLL